MNQDNHVTHTQPKPLSNNEMAILRYQVSRSLIEAANILKDPDAPYNNVGVVMDLLDYLSHQLDQIRHSAFPEWFEENKK